MPVIELCEGISRMAAHTIDTIFYNQRQLTQSLGKIDNCQRP